jgi:leucyl-tRNA synthetase
MRAPCLDYLTQLKRKPTTKHSVPKQAKVKKQAASRFVRYDPNKIEPSWQKKWEASDAFASGNPKKGDQKKYVLDMFPYPSGEGLHVGHVESYTASDIVARYNRMRGAQVLHPMGWDAFGLPAENFALKTGVHPRITTKKNTDNFRRQLKRMGFSYDWSRELNTTDPDYYKWTQWIFVKLFKMGLAYEAQVAINWCPSCKTGLANEEVIAGECARCGSIVGKKNLRQWLLKITQYADRLLKDLDSLDWPDRIKEMQRNWIGRSQGAEVYFSIEGSSKNLSVFTTRPDTLFGCTYVVLAPEHELVLELTTPDQKTVVTSYIDDAQKKSDLERTAGKKKTGVFTGSYAVNPINGQKVPIWVADYVLAGYGKGAIMAVPAHDQRDFEFATAHKLPIRVVVVPDAAGTPTPRALEESAKKVFEEQGRLVNSAGFTGMSSEQAAKKITTILTKTKKGKAAVHFKLRDWVFSRQRYWGEPIPIVHCTTCGAVAVPEEQLPVVLPEVKKFEPTGTGESPLASIDEWVNTTCPNCEQPARRETNTMPQWAGSSWYFLRFADPHNDREAWSQEAMERWLPVDFYIGGAEHAVLHLLYARFWVKALHDAGFLSFVEPFIQLRNQGIITAEDGRKMSKSLGNVVNPDDVVAIHGADALRLFEMFLGPLDQPKVWSTKGIAGIDRFLERVWRLNWQVIKTEPSSELDRVMQKVTHSVTGDIEKLHFNTAISSLMQFTNTLLDLDAAPLVAYERLVVLLAPMAPHIAEELWSRLGHSTSIFKETWPVANKSALVDARVMVILQVNGKFRGRIEVVRGASQESITAQAQTIPTVQNALKDKKVQRVVFVKDKILNFIAS